MCVNECFFGTAPSAPTDWSVYMLFLWYFLQAARLASAGIYNTAKGALQVTSRKGGAVRRHKSPAQDVEIGTDSPQLAVIPERDDDDANVEN